MGEMYDSDKYGVLQTNPLTGNDKATMLCTPQVGTAAETKTHTTTCKPDCLGRKIKIKNLFYLVDTAYTGAGNALAIDIYVGTTSSGSLAVTSEAALAIATSSTLDIDVTAAQYIRLYLKSTTTASDAQNAIGSAYISHQEYYS